MQINISKEDVLKALDKLECRRATKLLREHYTLPDFISFGELLEGGGTVEKCCKHGYSQLICECPCHNKKEEKVGKGLCDTYHPDDCCPNNPKCGFFNRETSKEYEGCKTNCYHVKETTKVRLCTCACHEEVNLPEMIYLRTNSSLADIKINEILTYLASKENKI